MTSRAPTTEICPACGLEIPPHIVHAKPGKSERGGWVLRCGWYDRTPRSRTTLIVASGRG